MGGGRSVFLKRLGLPFAEIAEEHEHLFVMYIGFTAVEKNNVVSEVNQK